MDLYLHLYTTRKPILINIYNSHHITNHLTNNLLVALFSRASTHSSSLVQLAEEESHIYEALKQNGYPKNFIRTCKNQITSREQRPPLRNPIET